YRNQSIRNIQIEVVAVPNAALVSQLLINKPAWGNLLGAAVWRVACSYRPLRAKRYRRFPPRLPAPHGHPPANASTRSCRTNLVAETRRPTAMVPISRGGSGRAKRLHPRS